MRIAIITLFSGLALLSSNAVAAPMEYVRVCDAFGADFYYSPGSETCINAITGETKQATAGDPITGETEVLETAKDANEGVALSLALPSATVDAGKTFGAAANFGTFNGESAIGVSGAISPVDGLTINGAFGLGLARGTAGGRAGINYSW